MTSLMYRKWTCDRCEKIEHHENLPTRWGYIESYPNPMEKGLDNGKGYDLCPDCASLLRSFLANTLGDLEDTADILAELEQVKEGAKTLSRIIDRHQLDVLTITGAGDLIDANGDGDWQAVWDRLANPSEWQRTDYHWVRFAREVDA